MSYSKEEAIEEITSKEEAIDAIRKDIRNILYLPIEFINDVDILRVFIYELQYCDKDEASEITYLVGNYLDIIY